MPADLMRVKEIFLVAVEKPGPAERAAFLRDACAGDDDLRRQVEALLRQHEQASGFLEAPPPGLPPTVGPGADASAPSTAPAAAPPDGVGSRLGPYKLLQLLGKGGMGAVYLAEQERPVRRRVGVKVIKPGMDSAHVL